MADISAHDLLRLLPHRYPMLLVDRILECDDQKRIVAIKNVSFNEPFFNGHFPGQPIMPGVLQIEALAQTGGILLMRVKGVETGLLPIFMGIDKARFRRMVVPGDQLRLEVDLLTVRGQVARFQGRAFVGEALACEAELTCMMTEQEKRA
jgi:3-hydroxyacyl-[acyl-carrier-protein] dehydratase